MPLTTGEFAMLQRRWCDTHASRCRAKARAQMARGRPSSSPSIAASTCRSRACARCSSPTQPIRYIQTVWGRGLRFVPGRDLSRRLDRTGPRGSRRSRRRKTSPIPLDEPASAARNCARLATEPVLAHNFCLLAVLLLVGILAWLQALRMFEAEPRAIQLAQQIASLVNLSRAASCADAIARVSLIKTMSVQEGVRIVPREPDDRFEPLDETRWPGA